MRLYDRGALVSGKIADVIVLKPDPYKTMPLTDIYYTIVYSLCGNDVDTVFVNGKPLMIRRKILTMDEERIIKNVLLVVEKLYGAS